MVLQRNARINIWGFGAAGEKVSVSFAKQTKNTVTDQSGKWQVVLEPLKTSSVPQSMTIIGSNKIVLTDILVGEVWLCSGQSNMEYQMRKLVKIPTPKNPKLGFPKDEVENAKNTKIRIFLVNRKTLIKPDSIHKSWSIAQDSALRAFSAVGYFFAKALQQKLDIPIGIVCSSVSGSAIEPWISKEALAQEAYFKDKKLSNDPGKFYTPMIEPLTKFKLRGFLWYQGETNCFLDEKISYAYKMKVLINLWRSAWGGNETMPFYLVQIAPFNYSKQKNEKALDANTEPEFWEAQAQQLRLPHTGLIVTTDLNDNGEDLHPTYKWEVGRRLALWALANDYHQKVVFSGPLYKSVCFEGDKAMVAFDLFDADLKEPLTGFTVAGNDGKFVTADAHIVGKVVVVSAKEISKPEIVRFNWTESPASNFYGKTGLPALPFRTDNSLTRAFKIN
ncbi:sialate O-acetylesterase [Pedobacter sp. Du54]|uniref:sialate O-acetylesterase n=1 Tax=Pedobacter anseongensis TaxID=3133439 RepID=UPI0030A77FF7